MKTTADIIDVIIPQDRDNAFGYVKKCMIEYARQALKEQRKICAEEYAYNSNTNDSNNYEINGKGLKHIVMCEIADAPEPELK